MLEQRASGALHGIFTLNTSDWRYEVTYYANINKDIILIPECDEYATLEKEVSVDSCVVRNGLF